MVAASSGNDDPESDDDLEAENEEWGDESLVETLEMLELTDGFWHHYESEDELMY